MAEQFKRVLKEKGPTAVGMFGSGQWTVWEGYAGLKLMKAGFRSNNLDPERAPLHGLGRRGLHAHLRRRRADGLLRRHRGRRCLRAVGLEHGGDAPDPLDAGDRPAPERAATSRSPCCRPSSIARTSSPTSSSPSRRRPTWRSSTTSPTTSSSTGPREPATSSTSTRRSCSATPTSATGCGRSIRCRRPRRTRATPAAPSRSPSTSSRSSSPPTTWSTRPSSAACRRTGCEALAELYADPKIKVMSFWTMGFNQHTRGVWCNNMVYNIHLLTGKISTPGNSPFSLTGQPSACGTAREVGTFAHRLPADMVVTNPKHRAARRGDLEAAAGHHSRHARLPRGAAEPHAQGRQAQRLLGDGQQQHAGRRQPDAGRLSGLPQPGQLRRRVGCLPDRHRACRRPHPAGRDVGREGRRLRQRRAAHALLAPAGVARRARRAPTCGS